MRASLLSPSLNMLELGSRESLLNVVSLVSLTSLSR
jgi:hypothetical protein